MALLDQLMETMLGSSSVKSLSNISGADDNQVQQVLAEALPTLVQKMQKNASTKTGEAALSTALSDHAKDDTSDIGTFLNNVDLEDGDKIVSHILDSDKADVKYGISQKTGISADQIGTILAAAAPLLLSLLGNKKNETQSESNSSGGLGDLLGSLLGGNDNNSGGGLGDILGSLLGGNDNNSSSSNDSGGGLGGILGSILGGNDNNSSGNNTGDVVGDLLGSLLGGKTKKSSTKKTGAKRATKKKKK